MAGDVWTRVALPVLEAVANAEGKDHRLSVVELAKRTDLDPAEVSVELDRLCESGYLAGTVKRSLTRDITEGYLVPVRLTGAGAQIVGRWPSHDPYQALLEVLERRIAEAPNETDRTKWRKVRDTMTKLGSDVGTNFIATLIVEAAKAGL
jgi:DNA-binding IclR family transcriptional regulator